MGLEVLVLYNISYVCKCIWFVIILKKARSPLLKLMEQAQSGFGLLQDEENSFEYNAACECRQ